MCLACKLDDLGASEIMQNGDTLAFNNENQVGTGESSAEEHWLELERKWINAKGEPSSRFSLSLSGGGVRAAAVARGLIDVFRERNLIKQLDYVSSVSGGGYASGQLIQVQTGATTQAQAQNLNQFTTPDYSGTKAIWHGVLEVLLRLWMAVTPVAGLMILIFSLVPKDRLLLIPILLGVAIFFLIERQTLWAQRILRLLFGSFIVFSLVVLVDNLGLVPVSLVLGGLLLWACVYVRVMPHRIATLSEMQHWPKMVILSLSVAYVVLMAKSADMFAHPLWIGAAFIVWLVSAIVYMAALRRNINAAQPLFSYYRKQLSRAYLNDQQVSLKDTPSGTPYPIFNVTANAGEQEFQMEIAPLFVGPLNGKRQRTPDGISMADAVASSASALDFTRQGWNANVALSFFLGGTGYWLPRANREFDFGGLMRVACNMPGNGTIRLADGGFTDNLGLMALLRRKAARIVCLDAAFDPQFQFEDLRRVCHMAVIEGVAEVNTLGLHEFGDELRFAQKKPCFVKLSIRYANNSNGEIWLIKLHHHNAELRKKFFGYPHITTSDQQLLPSEVDALRELGESLANETLDAMGVIAA